MQWSDLSRAQGKSSVLTLTKLPLMHDGLEPAAHVDQNFSNHGDWMITR